MGFRLTLLHRHEPPRTRRQKQQRAQQGVSIALAPSKLPLCVPFSMHHRSASAFGVPGRAPGGILDLLRRAFNDDPKAPVKCQALRLACFHANRRSTFTREAIPTPAAQHLPLDSTPIRHRICRTGRVICRAHLVVIRIIPILTPLPDQAVHVVKTP